MLLAALWLALALGTHYFTSHSPTGKPVEQLLVVGCSSVVIICSICLIFDHSVNYQSVTDGIAVMLFAAAIAVYIRIIRIVSFVRASATRR